MSAEQIAAVARLWRQGYDTFAIAKSFSAIHVPEHSFTPTNYEAIIYNNLGASDFARRPRSHNTSKINANGYFYFFVLDGYLWQI